MSYQIHHRRPRILRYDGVSMPPDEVGQAPTILSGELESADVSANTVPTVDSGAGSDSATTTRLLACIDLGPGVEIGEYRVEGKVKEP